MAVLIDTSIAIDLRDGHRAVRARLKAIGEQPFVSMITAIELEGGIYAKPVLAAGRRISTDRLLRSVPVLGLDRAVVQRYGRILHAIGFSRPRLLDYLIAATSIVHDMVLITSNGADFCDIPDLKLEVWPPLAQ